MQDELDIKFPEINYDGAKKFMYDYLEKDPDSPFEGQTLAAIFTFAMALAKRDGMSPEALELPKRLPSNAFDSHMRVLMRSILIDEKKDVYSIKDNIELRRRCGKYANAGIDKLYNAIKNRDIGKDGEDVLVELLQS